MDIDNVLIEDGTNMMYSGSTTEQPNTSNVAINSSNNDIIRLLVVTNKPDNPISTTSITFNTTGSTSAANDLAAAKVFYTTTPEFSTTTQFGSTLNSPSGTFSITGSQSLAGGNNFFWLAYDIRSTATLGNVVDAQCTQFITSESGSNKTPQTAAPTGNRKIGTIISSTKSIPGDYPTLAAAVTALNNAVVGEGGVTFNIAAGYSENITVPIVLTATGTSDRPLIFQKSGAGSNPLVTRTDGGTITTSTMGNNGDGVIIVEGSDYVTFDGIDVTALNQGVEYGYYLRKASVTDGCKHVSIRNSVITMTKGTSRYVVGFCAANNSSSSNNISVTIPGGRHEQIIFTGNIISNVFTGVYLKGHDTFSDNILTIGSLSSPNTIQNFAGNFAAEAYGIYIENVVEADIGYNSINNLVGGGAGFTAAGTGIYNMNTNGSNIQIHHNTLNISTQATGQSFYGIRNRGNGATHIEHNTITLSNTASTVQPFYFIANDINQASDASHSINNNSFAAGDLYHTGGIYLIFNTNSQLSPAASEIMNNTVSGPIVRTGASGTFYGYYNNGSPTGTEIISGNDFSNISQTGTTIFYGIFSYTSASNTQMVYNNLVSMIGNGSGSFIAIDLGSSNNRFIYGNQIKNISTGGNFIGINANSAGATNHINKNLITDISTTSTSSSFGICNGILIPTGSNTYVYNNFISDLKTPASGSADAIRAISITSTLSNSFIGLYYNTIFLNATSTATTFGTTGVYHVSSSSATTASLDMRNNILVNKSTAKGSARTVVLRRTTSSLDNFSQLSDNNILYAGTPGASNVIYFGATGYQTVETYKAHVSPREINSHTEDPPFVNVSTAPFNLHLQTTVPTLAESAGQRINNPIEIDEDFDGENRSLTTPDIGADEFSGIAGLVLNPASFTAMPISSRQTRLNFATNAGNNEIVIVFNTSGSFTTPAGEPTVGQPLANGTVLYIGINSPYTHGSLTTGTPYYYKAFSYNGASYSTGLSANATPGVASITNLAALPVNQSQINLSWNKNAADNEVMIASHNAWMNGNPVNGTGYNVGNPLTGGGIIIYKGPAEGFSHTGLSTWSQYYYKCWSFDNYNYYSTPVTSNEITYADPITSFPYLQDFGGTWSHSPAAPEGWNVKDLNGSGSHTWIKSIYSYKTAPAGAQGYATGVCNDYLISPPLHLPDLGILLSWWEKVSQSSNISSYKVLLSTSNKEVSSFTIELGDFTCTNTEWVQHSIDLSAYSGQTIHIAFFLYFTTSQYQYFAIDDVLIETSLPGPAAIEGPMDGLLTFNESKTLSWTAPPSFVPVDGFKVYFGTNPDPATLVYNGANLYYTTEQLQYNNTYNWKVVPYNINGEALDVPVWSFSTVTESQLAESFEDEWFLPIGWSLDAGYNWFRTNNSFYHGLRSVYRTTTADHAKIRTPKVGITSNSRLSFFAGTNSSTWQRVQLYYSIDKNTWLPTGDEISIIPGDWRQYTVELGSMAGNNYYLGLAVYFATGGSGASVYFDHIVGPEIVPILPAAAKYPDPMDGSDWMPLQTSLKWYPELVGGIPSGYKIYVGTDGGGINTPTNMINGQLITQNTFTPPALSNNTVYYWKIVPTNSAGDAINCPIWSFSTLPNGAIQVGYGSEDWTGLPVDVEYAYTYSQSIYLQSEIGIGGQWIEKIYYYWNSDESAPNSKDWVIYMGHTDKTEFINDFDWVHTSEMIKVFDGEVILPDESGWIEITLDILFQYNNDDNLVVAVDENTMLYDWGEFYATDTEGFRSLLYSSDSHNMNPDNPTEGGLVEAIPNLRMVFESDGPPPASQISPDLVDFGFILVNTISEPEIVQLQNIGGGILTISDIYIDGNDADHFSIANSPVMPLYLNTYSTLDIQVLFAPTLRGEKNATLKIQSNQAGGTTHEVQLFGIGQPIEEPMEFNATTSGLNSILLEWLKNSSNDDVMIAFNTTQAFGEPEDGVAYSINDVLTDGGTVIYKGSLLSFIHTNLSASQGYFYAAWSVNTTNNYSMGVPAYGQTSCNAVYDIPISEDFENIPFYQIPVCWSRIIESADKDGEHYIGVGQGPYSTNQVLVFCNDYEIDPTLILVSPELNANINTLSISFDFFLPGRKSKDVSDGITVGVISDPEDVNTFTPLKTFTHGDWIEEWTRLKHNFHQYDGSAKHIALKANFSYWSIHFIYVDNILIDFLPSCIPPTDLQSSDITTNSAILSWQVGHEEDKWQLKYGPTGFDPLIEGTLVPNIITYPYLLENLQHSMVYDVYVRSECALNDHSEWVGPHAFATLCEAVSCPVSENFDSTPSGEIPICWSAISDENSFAQTISNSPDSPPNCLIMESYAVDEEVFLISPEIIESISDLYISFSARRSYTSGSLILGTMSDPTDANTFQYITSFTLTETWDQYVYNFENYSGSHQYIVFQINTYGTLFLDDIIIDIMTGCIRPSSLAVLGVTSGSALINWNYGADETLWDLVFGQPGFDPGTEGTMRWDITSKPYELTGLSASTSYHVYVRSRCEDELVSEWVGPMLVNTLCDESEKCDYTVLMTDSYGDGWDGTVLGFKQNGVIVGTFGQGFTNGFSYPPVNVPLCPDLTTQIVVVELGGYTDEKGFSVYDPEGVLVYQRSPGNTFTSSTVFHTFTTECPSEVPLNLQISNETVQNGQEECYDAELTITTAGGGSYFTVQNGGSALLIAGQNIVMLPGTHFQSGSYVHAFIDLGGNYCTNFTSVVSEQVIAEKPHEAELDFPTGLFFMVYPNPTSGNFTLELMDDPDQSQVHVEIYSLLGERIASLELSGVMVHNFRLEAEKPGIFLVRVVRGSETGVLKLVKQ